MKTNLIKENALIFRSENSSLFLRPENSALPFSLCIFHSHNENSGINQDKNNKKHNATREII